MSSPDPTHQAPLVSTPDWVKQAVFYQIFPDRFARGTQKRPGRLTPTGFEAWDAPPTLHGYKGGDLWGVLENLDYLQDLGITALYLNPIFQAAANHRYHTHDYYRIDPLLGGDEAFARLLEAAHARGMRIVLDGVFNHVGRGFFPFHDLLENGPASPWLDWFQISRFPLGAYSRRAPTNYRCWANLKALPKLNHHNPEVREYLMRVGEHWVRQGIDGWRLDVAREIVAPGFWAEFRARVKAVNPEAYLVGEVWGEAEAWLDGNAFDGVMNYALAVKTLAFVAGDRIDRRVVANPHFHPCPALTAGAYAKALQGQLGLYPWEIQLTQLNLLGSHDTPRLWTVLGGDRPSLELAAFLLFTLPGAPCIYYGDEVGLPGRQDPDCRRGFPLRHKWDTGLQETFRRLIALRRSYPALQTGSYRLLRAEGSTLVYARELEVERLVAAVNAGDRPARLCWGEEFGPLSLNAKVFGPGAWIRTGNGQPVMLLPPRSGTLIVNVPFDPLQ